MCTQLGVAVAGDPTRLDASPDACEALGHVCSCIDGLIPELKPADAALIRRIDLDGAPRSDVAAGPGITVGALGVRLHRARHAARPAAQPLRLLLRTRF